MMKNILPQPHGGCGLINRFIHEDKKDELFQKALKYKAYIISNADLATFYRIADGTLSPIEGPMGRAEFSRVLEKESIERNAKPYAWTIPIAFPVKKEDCRHFKIGETVAIKTEQGAIVGVLEISDIYPFDKLKYNSAVYGTFRIDHPGPRIVNNNPADYLLGGKILAFLALKHPAYGRYMLSPKETRELFLKRRWERVVSFQTRNPLHRAHEYAIVYALECLTKAGHFTGAVLNPLVGETKSDDVPAEVRMRTYEALLENKVLGRGDIDEAFWKTKQCCLHDQLSLIGLEMKMFYAGPKEAIMHAIYRQNHGFTDIIIGRKHADAPFDDGSAAWTDFAAQDKFSGLIGELLIKPFKISQAAYFAELGRVALVEDYKDKGFREISISGKELRNKLEKKEPIDESIMRRPVVEILYDAYQHNIAALRSEIKSTNIAWHDTQITKSQREAKNGHRGACIWLTGLSCSGKSTLAVELQSRLFKMGYQVFILDGDNIRHGLNRNLGFSPEDRQENIRRITEVAKLFTEAGFLVITAFISPYRQDRDNARASFPENDFIEVFLNSSVPVCEARDTKGLYKKARAGQIKEFTGISAPYEEPLNPELSIDTGNQIKEVSTKIIFDYLLEKKYISGQ